MLGHAPPSPIPGQVPHPPLYWLLLWVAAWMLAGLTGHTPWRSDEIIQLALAVDVLDSGRWLAPQLGGLPMIETPPWAAWMSALAIAALQPAGVAPHDAARFPALAALLLCFWALLRWGHPRLARRERWACGLALFSALSLILPAHSASADLWALAGFALITGALIRPERRWPRTAVLLGSGLTLAALAGGVQVWLPGVLATLLVGAVQRQRSRHFAHVLAIVGSLVLVGIWLIALQRAGLLHDWLAQDPLLRAFAEPLEAGRRFWPELRGLLWSWPVWPLALWLVLQFRRTLLDDPRLLAPCALLLTSLLVWWLVPGGRESRSVALLAPLAMLAGPALLLLPRGGAQALYGFGLVLFAGLVAILLIYWSGAHLGVPDFAERRMIRLLSDYDPSFAIWQPVLALAMLVVAVAAIYRLRRTPLRPLLAWCIAASVTWLLVVVLASRWIDTSRSYASTMVDLAQHLPADQCVGAGRLDDALMAWARVYAGVTVLRDGRHCQWRLTVANQSSTVPLGAEVVWSGSRAGDRNDPVLLYRLEHP